MADEEPGSSCCDVLINWMDTFDIPDSLKSDFVLEMPDTHSRGISIEQLEELGKFLEQVLEKYTNLRDGRDPDIVITKENINLHHINTMFILPLTDHLASEKKPFSYVELVAPPHRTQQEPSWFVSHWWGTPFFDTLRMLKLHAKQRDVDLSEEFYWICLFANCQHKLDELEETHYLQTPFAKALMAEKCRGSVVLLDEKNATPFTRSWCVFENFVSATHCATEKPNPHVMDFATIIPEGESENSSDTAEEWSDYLVVGYTGKQCFNQRCSGLLYQTSSFEGEGGSSTTAETTDHPGNVKLAWFPADVSMLGFKVDISKANATREVDARNIERWVGDQKDNVNRSLRRKFSRSAIYMAATEIGDVDVLKEIMESSSIITTEEAIRFANEEGCINDAAEYQFCDEHEACVRYLLEKGCNPDQVSLENNLPLDTALEIEYYDMVRLLLNNGANPKLVDMEVVSSDCPKDIIKRLSA